MKIKNKYGVVNTVSEDKFEYLMSLNEGYEKAEEPVKRKRRTKAEIEADKAKEEAE